MKVTVRDSHILKTIEPNVLEKYLQINGWHKARKFYEGFIWIKKNSVSQEGEVLVSPHQDFDDFAEVMCRNLKALEVIENRSQLDILSDLITVLPNVAISGWINKVYGAESPDQITLIGFVVGKLRKINLELPEADYQLALKAYEARSPVTCFGDLIKENDGFVLNNPRDFALLSEAELIS
ncbi:MULTISPECIES: hypothetical protein [unclassified Microcoleus]|jgi:hypothetical protein|uniref:hypothetical protein n=1 Tax=unclassified Microcoleus TaxID=2642155 RepID=UPI001DDA2353|nr:MULTISPECIES: hypothetical protein [unclassified Microcoleus]MCC3417491.1 hypothetical protein [Microcoleus sp. PH2017_07_MST_O_A]MCC3431444.1 hypothetical protein [Microcoleus sp. PH2017_04_SCI_O_A]MCC3470065.1 hypothetical protein [Microcoleus sp. PH2017_06_SFM_O_A]MCC3508057.1 hypothetical protein [Microcoleus sp. PH2017_17_BER_D_A]TAE66576.1 MAG: hypothetical protein EAZ86_19965 [Oscillatoriales cyanobacterium]